MPLLALLIVTAGQALADTSLHDLRALRRAAVRAAALTKADGGVPFGLLVLPVDFADARFADDFDPSADLAPRLVDDMPGALGHYVDVASQGRTDLAVTLAPVISLTGERQDYSDIGWQGNERSRRLAREALERARELGVSFDAADADGDGEVDGVLILHAAPGVENDPDGLILPLQFFLAEPVIQRGTVARSYAVAAERSTLGIWAHESAHLLGLEDRYDHALAGDGEAGPRGGLGRFSLMASGWLGNGDGTDPALPDAYSRLSLGWADLAATPTAGAVTRARLSDPTLPEYFLTEQRDPASTAPYDAALPAGRLLIYHVDETLAEGEASSPTWPGRHLRVQLVEADGGEELARGEDDGSPDDLFPFANTTQVFADNTIPNAHAWTGVPTGADLTISSDGVTLAYQDNGREVWADLRLPLVAPATFQAVALLPPDADRPDTVAFELAVTDPTWGQFTTGTTFVGVLVRTGGNSWHDHTGPQIPWVAAGAPPPGATTPFTFTVAGGAVATGELVHVWDATWADLDLSGDWPGNWVIDHPGGDSATTWLRWLDGNDGLPPGPLLACTGTEYPSAAAWPEIAYGNDAHVTLVIAPLGADVRWLDLEHSPHLELLHSGAAVDGVGLTWVHVGGATVTAEPVDGWLGTVAPRSRHPLAGKATFAVNDSLDGASRPLWRREVLPLPEPGVHGPGPWQLRLELASNGVYRDRGWLVRELAAHLDPAPSSAFPIWLDTTSLNWIWASGASPTCFSVQRSDDGGGNWATVAQLGAGTGADHALPREQLGLRPGVRSRVRVLAGCEHLVTSREILAADAREPTLSLPRPNPCSVEARIRVDGAGDALSELGVFDLRGRRVQLWRPGSDPTTVVWQGRDTSGRRVAAGVYIFRLRAQGRTLTRKVTWLP